MRVTYEEGFAPSPLAYLSSVGHDVQPETKVSVVSAIVRTEDGKLQANSDKRRDGGVDGF